MLHDIADVLRRPLSTDARDASVGSKFLYAAGLLVFVLSTLKIASLHVTEAQLVLGLLAAVCAGMQLIVMGLLLEIRSRLQERKTDNAAGAGR